MKRIHLTLAALLFVIGCNAQPASDDELNSTEPLVDQQDEMNVDGGVPSPSQASAIDPTELEPAEPEQLAANEGSGDIAVVEPAPELRPYTNTIEYRTSPRLQLDPTFRPSVNPNQLRVPPSGATDIRLQPTSNH